MDDLVRSYPRRRCTCLIPQGWSALPVWDRSSPLLIPEVIGDVSGLTVLPGDDVPGYIRINLISAPVSLVSITVLEVVGIDVPVAVSVVLPDHQIAADDWIHLLALSLVDGLDVLVLSRQI